jgi:magnesium transporter
VKNRRKPMPLRKTRKPYLESAGLPPGTLVRTGERKTDSTRITLINYSEKGFEERDVSVDKIPGPDTDPSSVQWVNVEGLDDVHVLETIGKQFGLHSLVLEDILNTDQRPKIEDYSTYTYTVVKVLSRTSNDSGDKGIGGIGGIITEQESLILGDGFILTFGERRTDIFKPVMDRIKNDVGRIRKTGADFLLYALLDVIVDNYFVVLEDLGEKIEYAEDELVSHPTSATLKDIYALKREMLWLHKAVWPFREVIGSLERGETNLMKHGTDVYLRDLYDHAIQVMDIADTLRDILSSMLDIYLSSVSNRMNEIMKVLTIISTIFMPLSFIVGLYGMNLIMPETSLPWMYPVVCSVMVVIAGAMLVYFKRKKWW